MASRKKCEDVNGKPRLTNQERVFMVALQKAVSNIAAPVSVDQIRVVFQKSDSRVRSNLKVLVRKGYIRCVGKSKVKCYVPSMLWLEEIDGNEEFDSLNIQCFGGKCETLGCDKMAEDYWRNGYYCRDCIIGHDDKGDEDDLRRNFFMQISLKSSAGDLLDCIWPTIGDDIKEKKDKREKKIKRSRVMRFKGRVWKDDEFWLVEVPDLDVMTQGHSKREALGMIADAVEGYVNRPGFRVNIYNRFDGDFEIGCKDPKDAEHLVNLSSQRKGLRDKRV